MKRLSTALFGLILLCGCGTDEPLKPGAGTIPVSAGTFEPADPDDWCGGHGLPESMCTKCNPELIAGYQASGDWCAGHGFPESACPSCNPMTPPSVAATTDWCGGHGLPESMCTKCNPELIAGYQASGDWCAGHGFPESACPSCNPMTPPDRPVGAAVESRIVRFRSAEIEQAAGIQTVLARARSLEPRLEVNARVAFDPDRVADIRALVPGLVREIHVAVGDRVTPGQPLLTLESTHVGDLQAMVASAGEHLRVAEANLERMRSLRERGVATDRQVEVAEGEVASERAELNALRASLRLTGAGATEVGRYTLHAPTAGVVTQRAAVRGAHATSEMLLARIVDTRSMWVMCDVPEDRVGRLNVGAGAGITINGRVTEGRLTWIAPEVDARTRMVHARVEAANRDGVLRANQFAVVTLEVDQPRVGLAVPAGAVQRIETEDVVFVRLEPGIYAPRVVTRIGGRDPVWVRGNLTEGEPVVTTGAVLLKTEVLPGSIGSGCCEVEPLAGEPR